MEILLPNSRRLRRLISALILFHVIVIPVGSYFGIHHRYPHPVIRLMTDYAFGIRAHQFWALFSPEPRRQALRYSAIIQFRDRTSIIWRRPYPPKWDFFERHRASHFQKWDLVSQQLDERSALWNSLVNYLAVQYGNKLNPIAQIRFIRSQAYWPKPNPSGYVGGEVRELEWTDTVIFTYDMAGQKFL